MMRTADAQIGPALTIRNALNALLNGEGFSLVAPVARKTEFGKAGVPTIYVGLAAENLDTAMDYTAQIVEQLKADAKRADGEVEVVPNDADNLDPDLFDVR